MKKEVSTNYVVLITLIAIAISTFSIFLSLEKLGITGLSSYGYTNVTVSTALDITIVRAQINFTDSAPGVSKDSTDHTHVEDCSTDFECGINITNDGSVAINITITDTEALFDGSTLNNSKHYLYNVTLGDHTTAYIGDNRCSTGYVNSTPTGNSGLEVTTSGWRAMPESAEVAICCLNFTDSHDSVQVDINITVPNDEPAGIKSGLITFTASAWE